MLLKEFGKTGRKISEIGMGTYYDPLWIASGFLGWRRGAGAKLRALQSGLGSGITLIDTAEIYRSEPIVAEAIRGLKREELFIATKVWSNHLHRDSLIKALDKSLKRLKTSYIDLYQVHFPSRSVPIKETMAAMEELVREGKLLHIGVSNFSLQQLEEANSALPKSELTSTQMDYSLIHRNVEADILPYCNREKIVLMAYYPLGHGKLVSDPRLDDEAGRHGKTRTQVALRWLAEETNVFPIPRASSIEHVMENVGAGDWELTEEEKRSLSQKFQ